MILTGCSLNACIFLGCHDSPNPRLKKKNADRKQDNQAMITIQSTVCKNVYPTILVSVVCMCILLHVLVEDVIHKQYEDLLIIFVSFKVIVKSLGAFKS